MSRFAVSENFLSENHAPSEMSEWFLSQNETDGFALVRNAIKNSETRASEIELLWANFLTAWMLSTEQRKKMHVFLFDETINPRHRRWCLEGAETGFSPEHLAVLICNSRPPLVRVVEYGLFLLAGNP